MNEHFLLIFFVGPGPEGCEENQFGGFLTASFIIFVKKNKHHTR
jgi:hypothetical protein